MSVRRLAEVTLQPPNFAFNDNMSAQAQVWIAKYPEGRQQSAVIPLLMLAQEQDGWITKAAIEGIANMLGMPYIRVLEVATFYTQFQLKPVGSKAHVQVCGTTPCMLRGSEALMDVCRHKIHHDQFHLNASGTLSWEEVECLGACVNAPMVMIFKDTYEDLTPERLGEIIDAFGSGNGEGVTPGPQDGRFVSTPASGQKTLLDEQVFFGAKDKFDSKAAAPQGEAETPPSKAAKPATDAFETNAAVKSPSPVKVDRATEGAKESEAPPHNGTAADKAEPAVEGADKDRTRPIRGAAEPAPYKAPELEAKPRAGESGSTIQVSSQEPVAAPSTSGMPDKALPGTDATGENKSASVAGVDSLGTSMGAAAAPAEGPDAPAITVENVSPGPVVQVSDSNALAAGGEQLAAEPRRGGEVYTTKSPVDARSGMESAAVAAAPAAGGADNADRAAAVGQDDNPVAASVRGQSFVAAGETRQSASLEPVADSGVGDRPKGIEGAQTSQENGSDTPRGKVEGLADARPTSLLDSAASAKAPAGSSSASNGDPAKDEAPARGDGSEGTIQAAAGGLSPEAPVSDSGRGGTSEVGAAAGSPSGATLGQLAASSAEGGDGAATEGHAPAGRSDGRVLEQPETLLADLGAPPENGLAPDAASAAKTTSGATEEESLGRAQPEAGREAQTSQIAVREQPSASAQGETGQSFAPEVGSISAAPVVTAGSDWAEGSSPDETSRGNIEAEVGSAAADQDGSGAAAASGKESPGHSRSAAETVAHVADADKLKSSTAMGTVLGGGSGSQVGQPEASASAAERRSFASEGQDAGERNAAAVDDAGEALAGDATHAASLDHAHRPAGIERPAELDDLKMISGIGPKTEEMLHNLGIYTFAQVASWNKAQRHWVGGYLKFHGRIERDDWVGQAKALAVGGEEEYVRVFGKKPR